MTSSVTSAPITIPTGIRASKGTITLDTSYAGGTVITPAQFGGGANGLPNRNPDAVILHGRQGTLDFTNQGVVNYDPSTGKVHVFGTAFNADQDTTGGISEEATETLGALLIDYVALWLTPDPSGISTVVA
jgi:hypothetical protein